MNERFNELINYASMLEERKDAVISMLDAYRNRIEKCPASTYGHACHEGGLLDHTLSVIDIGVKLYKVMLPKMDLVPAPKRKFPAFESVIFVCLVHDLGKLGTPNMEYYIRNPEYKPGSTWYNSRSEFKISEAIVDVVHEINTINILQHCKIPIRDNEMQAIVYHAGAYGKGYEYIRREDPLTLLVHMADNLSTKLLDI